MRQNKNRDIFSYLSHKKASFILAVELCSKPSSKPRCPVAHIKYRMDKTDHASCLLQEKTS